MTAKEYLGQLKTLARNIDILYENIERDRARLESVTISLKPDKVQTSVSGDKFGDAIARLADKDLQRRDMVVIYEGMRDRIIDQIMEVPSLQGTLLYEHYVKFKPWHVIAAELHYSESHVYNQHLLALQTFDKLYGPFF